MVTDELKLNEPAQRWFKLGGRNGGARLRLFCFHYAGGGASVFRRWPDRLPQEIEICPVQLPGRENRIKEKPYTRMDRLVTDLGQALLPHVSQPYAFFGHSMGAMVAFELARWLRAAGAGEPRHLFVSGRRAPHFPDEHAATYRLPQAEFVRHLHGIGGTPVEVFQSPELLELFLPIIRADFELINTHPFVDAAPLMCPVSAYGGTGDDDVSEASVRAWCEYTTGQFAARLFPGDHFFFRSAEPLVLADVRRELEAVLGGLSRLS